MDDLGDLDAAPFPSAREFREFLTAEYPLGMDGLVCLDAGCGGTAINSRSLLAARGVVVAMDLNQGSLRFARQSMSRGARRPVAFVGGSLLDLPVRRSAFDFVVCSGVVHHTPDPERAVRELRAVVKPSARLYISAYCFESSLMAWVVRLWRLAARVIPFSLMHRLFRHSAIVNNFVLDHMYVPLLWIYRAGDFTAMLERSGFRVERSFVSSLDRFANWRLGPWSMTGDGLLRVFVCVPATDPEARG